MIFEFKLPDIGEGVIEGEIVTWKVKPGEAVVEDQPLVEVMTDKATVEIPSPRAGIIIDMYGKAGDKIKVGAVLLKINIQEGTEIVQQVHTEEEKQAAIAEPADATEKIETAKVLATPAIRRIAHELQIDLSCVRGSGEGGRILKEDLVRLQEKPTAKTAPVEFFASIPENKEIKEILRAEEKTIEPTRRILPPKNSEERVPYIGIRRKIGENMQTAKAKIPHFTYVDEVDMTELVELRKEFLPIAEQKRIKLTYLPFMIKTLLAGLIHFPLVNSSLDEAKGEIVLKKYYNIGIATATEKGLMVPVVKNVDTLKMLELAVEIDRIATSARTGKIAVEDLKNGTFSITNVGSIGGLFSSPIINYPEVGIMGIHKIHKRPVVKEESIVIREMMYLSFSFDHRIVDGALAAEFAHYLIKRLENPSILFLEIM